MREFAELPPIPDPADAAEREWSERENAPRRRTVDITQPIAPPSDMTGTEECPF